MTTYEQAGQTYEDVDFLYDGMLASQGVSVLIGTLTDWRDFTDIFSMGSASITDAGTNARSTASFALSTRLADAPEIIDQGLIAFVVPGAGPDIFRGLIRSRRPRSGMKTMLDIIADDLGGLLDDSFIPSEVRPAETMVNRITYLWTTYGSPPLDLDDLSFVAAIGGTLLAQNFAGVTLRQAIEATINQVTDADYYVDTLGKLHIFTSESNAAPYAVIVGTPGGGQIAPEDLDIDWDSNAYANRVYVQGATPAGSGFFRDDAAIAAVGGMIRTAVLQAPDCETSAMATALANMYLGRVSSAKPRGSFTASSPYDGWRAGQNVTITEADMGISAQVFRIANVTTTFRGKATSFEREYAVQFGGSRAGGTGVRSEGIGGGQVVSGQLGGASNVYVTSEGVAVTDTLAQRVWLGKLPSGDYGLQVVSSDGATVIIDGSSDMFKIAATGTLTADFPGTNSNFTNNVKLAGLGDQYTIPPAASFLTTYDDSLATQARNGSVSIRQNNTTGVIQYAASSGIQLTSGYVLIVLNASSNTVAPGTTAACRYYVFAEAGI